MKSVVKGRAAVALARLCCAVGLLIVSVHATRADRFMRPSMRLFAFPLSLVNGVSGDLVLPAGSSTVLRFDVGKVAVGELPIPLADRPAHHGRRGASKFIRPLGSGPRVRLLLRGVADGSGNPITNSGNQLIIDAVVSPGGAASTPPPFVVPFDIDGGNAFVDASLPVMNQAEGAVRVQVLGVRVLDPDGQPFGVLGFELRAVGGTPNPSALPTPNRTPEPDGHCFAGPHCSGPSFVSSQDTCCRLGRPLADHGFVPPMSWCPPGQLDPQTGACAANACIACQPDGSPSSCSDRPVCNGRCVVGCADGRLVAGVCSDTAGCQCTASCDEPPTPSPVPCGVGQCFDTITFQCTGHACGAGMRCPLPSQFCDASGRRCPCASPSPPPGLGHVCCQCGSTGGSRCMDIAVVEVQPLCPAGCETFVGQSCAADSGTCVGAQSCASDAECDDGNGCTVDHCRDGACDHDCVCVGPVGCGPGPGRGHSR